MELLSILGGKIAAYTIEPVARQVGYVINLKSNVENLKTQLDSLAGAQDRVQHSVAAAVKKGHKIEADVEKWQRRVEEIIAEANEFLKDENQVKKKCLFGFCPSLISSRYQPSRKATKLAQKVVDIQKRGEFPSVSYATPPKDTWTTAGYRAFESRISFMNDIMKELIDPEIYTIGIYGMAGVGKSTLVKEVARQAEEELFLDVARVEVKQNTDVKRIQQEIAEKFTLELDENMSIAGRARILCDYIKKKKKVLVILDDVWEKLDLEALGLPIGICKILLTSRKRDILSSEIGTEKEFRLEVLDEQESWSLFENIVGGVVKDDHDIQDVAIEVAKRCAGLPILAVTLAKTLKGKSLHSWRDALRLQKMCEGKEMEEKAYSGIEWSYNQLEGEEVKSLFLICGMLGGNNLLNDVFKYTKGMGLSLYEGIDTMEDARNRLHSLVDKLKDSCLVLDTTADDKIVKMHDLTRDIARKIASRDHHFLSKVYGDEFKEWPNKQFLEKCTLISFSPINIPTLPLQLECPKLQVLLLDAIENSVQIPDDFFKEMKELKVLDLTRIYMSSLPRSIHFLTNLQTLCLDQCQLRDIAMLGELSSLEILSFIYSKFKLLPKEIGQLTRLRVLDMTGVSQLKMIHPNVISSLTRLEELRMNNSFIKWEIEEVINISERSNANLSELKHLAKLTTLHINVKDSNQLSINCFSEKLINFMISIGDVWNGSAKYTTSKTLKLKLSQNNQLDEGLQTLMKKSEELHLDALELEGVNDIVYQLDIDGFPGLKYLHVQNNCEILHIVNCGSIHVAFPILKELFLCNLVSLESLCSGQLPLGSFSQLTVIKVEKCPKLKNLFSFSTVRHFLQLQEVEVLDCNKMKEIAVEEKEENFEAQVNDRIVCCQLRSLTLRNLPELTCFASNNNWNIIRRPEEINSNNEFNGPMGLFNHKLGLKT